MDPTIAAFLSNLALESQKDHTARMARQADNAGVDHRAVTGWLLGQVADSGVPGQIGGLNTASHAPTPQPFVVPNFVKPA